MQTMTERIAAEGITSAVVPIQRPAAERGPDNGSLWYAVTLKRRGRSLTLPVGMGPGNAGEPDAHDALTLLRDMATSVENTTGFADWCSEWERDRHAEESADTYRAWQAHAAELRAFLGDAYGAWLWETEEDR